MNIVKFTETVFKDNDKKGKLEPDSDGYYTIILGALNTYNSAGEYYTASGVLQLFENSSILMRRIRNGALYAEYGHPEREKGMSLEDYYNRVLTIDRNNVCAHISEIFLDFNYGKNNPNLNNPELIAIIGKVKPTGPKSELLKASFENPKENPAFSIRGITENKLNRGRVERILTNIITWDNVIEPGIKIACKAYAPGLESINNNIKEVSDTIIDRNILTKVLTKNIKNISVESNKIIYQDVMNSIKIKTNRSGINNW